MLIVAAFDAVHNLIERGCDVEAAQVGLSPPYDDVDSTRRRVGWALAHRGAALGASEIRIGQNDQGRVNSSESIRG